MMAFSLPKITGVDKFISEYYVFKYWVGVMDGIGEIQISHWRYQFLQYRIEFKVKANPENEEFLAMIKYHMKGSVLKDRKNPSYLVWSENGRKRIERNVLPILKRYPFLSKRMRLQYLFMLRCMKHENVYTYLAERPYKYMIPLTFTSPLDLKNTFYFAIWLSGFTEVVALFTLRAKNEKFVSVSYTLKDELFLLEAIKAFFILPNKIRELKNNNYCIEVYNKSYQTRFVNHLDEHILLGHQRLRYHEFLRCVMLSFHYIFK